MFISGGQIHTLISLDVLYRWFKFLWQHFISYVISPVKNNFITSFLLRKKLCSFLCHKNKLVLPLISKPKNVWIGYKQLMKHTSLSYLETWTLKKELRQLGQPQAGQVFPSFQSLRLKALHKAISVLQWSYTRRRDFKKSPIIIAGYLVHMGNI